MISMSRSALPTVVGRAFRRHPLDVVIGGDPLPRQRTLRVSRCDDVLALTLGEGFVLEIKAELCLARGLVGPVALGSMMAADRTVGPLSG